MPMARPAMLRDEKKAFLRKARNAERMRFRIIRGSLEGTTPKTGEGYLKF